jgi:flagellar hook-basal body complex protein FliE
MGVDSIQGVHLAATESLGSLGSSGAPSTAAADATPNVSFGDLLGEAIDQVNAADAVAQKKTSELASGAMDDLHGTMISVKEADIAIKLVGTVRNKILDAFQEIWRTSV